MKTEPFWKSRRVWASALALIALCLVIAFPGQYDMVSYACMAITSALGITSFAMPKK